MLPALFVLAFAFAAARAMPISKPHELVVWRPEITYPTQAVEWVVGTTVNVTWDTSDMPPDVTNMEGAILLGHPDERSEHLNTTHPLAGGFSLADGIVYFEVPEVEERWDYVVALLGDSGNISPTFRIFSTYDDAQVDAQIDPEADTAYEE